jgi:chromosome segregation ATPase
MEKIQGELESSATALDVCEEARTLLQASTLRLTGELEAASGDGEGLRSQLAAHAKEMKEGEARAADLAQQVREWEHDCDIFVIPL